MGWRQMAAAVAVGAASAAAWAAQGPALSVDVAAGRHAINPYIYGMAYADPALAAEIKLPLQRWGGDATTRYNWQTDNTNAGDDWFFTVEGKPNATPSGGPDKMIAATKTWSGRALITIPIIDYINKATDNNGSFPVSLFGKQQKVNPYVHPTINGVRTDLGNGRTPDGKAIPLTKEQFMRIHRENTPAFQKEWVEHLVQTFGTTANGGVGMYELDNEPGGWNNTHRDVHPAQTGHDELVSRSIKYAAAIKEADPSAIVIGPGDFMMHYQSDGTPEDGKAQHGGLGQGDYYLQQFAAYEKEHGTRLLDYFDEHYYPTPQDGQTDDMRIEATRSLWDPTYKEKNWIGQWRGAIDLIPSFHKWVDEYYPGTKVSISEYGWGSPRQFVTALIEADVLGIFGREKLDMACLFGPPRAADAMANAFRIYRNYDGHGSMYGDTYVQSTSADQGQLAIYGAQRSSDHVLTLVIINKSHEELTSHVALSHFEPANSAQVFRYSQANEKAVVAQPDIKVSGDGFDGTFPAWSVTLVAVPGRAE